MKKFYRRITNLFICVAVLLGSVTLNPVISMAAEPDTMEVHFIDVGQGDATLIKCGEQSMLIDTADDSKGTAIQKYLQKQNVEKLDYLILTHPDADHIGGAPVVVTKFEINKVFMSNFEKDNKTYQKLIQALDNKRLKYETPEVGSQYTLGTAVITILAPNKKYDNPNDASIALTIQNGNNKFLFTGDACEDAEKDILSKDFDVSADVYKVGHHGSKSSSSRDFIKAVNPTYAVISCAENNSYGHPHAETLNTLRAYGINVYRTDEDGTIVATSDGKNITFNVPASETWKVGEPTGNSVLKAQTQAPAAQTQVQEQPKNESVAPVEETPQEPAISEPIAPEPVTNSITYVLNKNTKKFHNPSCSSVDTIKDKNREDTGKSRDEVIGMGYVPCKKCNP